jgi:hypothetical protein
MVFHIETFPDVILEELAFILEPKDLFQLSLTSKSLNKIFTDNGIWRR